MNRHYPTSEEAAFSHSCHYHIFSSEELEEGEQSIAANPDLTVLRAQLITHHYKHHSQSSTSTAKIKHLVWFIQNRPDWQFCGGQEFTSNLGESNYENLKALWLNQIGKSENLMRRVNAFFLLFENHDVDLNKHFRHFFDGHENDIWVMALRDLMDNSQSCFDQVIAELNAKADLDTEAKAKLEVLASSKDWNHIAGTAFNGSISDYLMAEQIFSAKPNLESAAAVAGGSFINLGTNTALTFNPEFIRDRLQISTWIIQNLPQTKLAKSTFYLAPFSDPIGFGIYNREGTSPLIRPIKFLVDCWMACVDAYSTSLKVHQNASAFASGIELAAPLEAKRLWDHLKYRKKESQNDQLET